MINDSKVEISTQEKQIEQQDMECLTDKDVSIEMLDERVEYAFLLPLKCGCRGRCDLTARSIIAR